MRRVAIDTVEQGRAVPDTAPDGELRPGAPHAGPLAVNALACPTPDGLLYPPADNLSMSLHDQPTQVLPTYAPPASSRTTPPPPPARRRHGRALLRWLRGAVLLAILVTLGITAAGLLLTPLREDVLILGSDARPDEIAQGEAGRTDTLMVLVADRAQPRLATVSVPRDLWVTIPGYGQERINAAFEFGGSQTAKLTVSQTIGQPIDRYVLVGLQGVRDVVNSMGGIDVAVPEAIHDDAYPTDDYGTKVVDIPAGPQHMDGETALEYARSRHQDNDFARAARQQVVLAAVRAKLMNPLSWWRVPAFVVAVHSSIQTDMTPLDVVAVGAAMVRHMGAPDQMVIDTSLADEVTGDDGAYLLQATPALKPGVAQFVGGPQAATIEVLNGSGVAGLAARTATRLTNAGFTVATVGNASQAARQTQIYAASSAQASAQTVAQALGLGNDRVSVTSGLPTGVTVEVLLGSDLGSS